jgi:tetratricopeptide (TPR) repeat protein
VHTLIDQALPLLRTLGMRWEVAVGYGLVVASHFADPSQDRQLLVKSLEIARSLHYDPATLWALEMLTTTALRCGALAKAEQYARETLTISRQVKDRYDAGMGETLLGHVAFCRGKYALAQRHYEKGLIFFQETDQTWAIGRLYSHLGDVAMAREHYQEAQTFHQRALVCYQDVGVHWTVVPAVIGGCWGVPISLHRLGDVALTQGDHRHARERYARGVRKAVDQPHIALHLYLLLGPARLLAAEGDPERAIELAVLAQYHPESVEETQDKAKELLDDLRFQLSPEVYAAAVARGQARDLEATIRELLDELYAKDDSMAAVEIERDKDA